MESTPMIRHERPTAGAATLRLRGRWIVALAALPLAIALGAGQAAAQDVGNRDFTLNNLTRFDIDKVSTSTPDSNVWTVLRNSSVASGSTVSFKFDNVGQCVLQLRVDFTDGNYAAWTDGFDFCNRDTVSIAYNGNNNTFRATAQ
jgi:hypothetical protein